MQAITLRARPYGTCSKNYSFLLTLFMKKSFENKETVTKARYFLIKRISPFLLLAIFLVFYFCYAILTQGATLKKYILIPFIIANSVYVDIALWNYFRGRKKGIIWIIECLITVLIISWIT